MKRNANLADLPRKPSIFMRLVRGVCVLWHTIRVAIAAVLLFLIGLYRKFISPILPPSCRFTPTCSQYAMEAIKKHGPFKGSLLSIWRILRCNPFCRGGYDPVP